MADPEVAIVYINYRSEDQIARSLRSLFSDPQLPPSEVVVFDNASPNGPPKGLLERFPGIKIYRAGANLGFARAANKAAGLTKAPFILLANPDTVIPPGTVKGLLDFMKAHPKAGACSPQAYYMDGTPQPVARRRAKLWYGLFGRRGLLTRFWPNNPLTTRYLYLGAERSGEPLQVEALIGAFLMLRREAFEDVGGFDERYFFTAEDIDLALKLRRRGWQIWLCPNLRVIHTYGGSRRRVRYFSEYHRFRAFYLYLMKNNPELKPLKPVLALTVAFAVAVMGFGKVFDKELKERSWLKERER